MWAFVQNTLTGKNVLRNDANFFSALRLLMVVQDGEMSKTEISASIDI